MKKSLHKTIVWSLCVIIIIIICYYSEASAEICKTLSCNPYEEDTIQFPFHVPANQTRRCGYPGFDLTCGRNGETLLNLDSKPLTVRGIYYQAQVLFVSDPNSCIPKRVLDPNLTASTPYSYGGPDTPTYTYLNCSLGNTTEVTLPIGTSVVGCLSGAEYTVMMTFERAAEEKLVEEEKCRVIKRVNAEFRWAEMEEGYYPEDMSDVILQLRWTLPNCGDCVINGGFCAFANSSGLDVACFLPPNSNGLPKSAKYGLILGAGVPAILCMIGLTYYISSRVRARNQNRHINTELSPAIYPQPIILRVGLDRPTIESYPKTILGESKRLPKTTSDTTTCPICLSEYQPSEALRSIPDCNHFFHVDCIDEWLRMNATCPLCRKSPQPATTL